jgi:hypothetical protein
VRKSSRLYLWSWCLGCSAVIALGWAWERAVENVERPELHELCDWVCGGGTKFVTVMRRDLPAGARLSFDDMLFVSRPNQFLDRDSLPGDCRAGGRLHHAVRAGDVLTFSNIDGFQRLGGR